MNTQDNYKDIINMPHHQSKTHPHMSMYDRAAQFSPFAALTGYDDAVEETARLTDTKAELSEDMKQEINRRLILIQENIKEHPKISITYFKKDGKKDGGVYVTKTGQVKGIDYFKRIIKMQDGSEIIIDDIAEIEL